MTMSMPIRHPCDWLDTARVPMPAALWSSALELMQLRIERPLCGLEMLWCYVSCGSTAGLRQRYLVATDLSVDLTCHPAADQARCGRPGAARAVGLDQEYDRQRQVEGQSLWVSALRQSVRCPGRQWVGMRQPSDQPRLLDAIRIDHVLPQVWWSRSTGRQEDSAACQLSGVELTVSGPGSRFRESDSYRPSLEMPRRSASSENGSSAP